MKRAAHVFYTELSGSRGNDGMVEQGKGRSRRGNVTIHSEVVMSHTDEVVSHTDEAVSHTDEVMSHTDEVVSHTDEVVSHTH